MILWREGINMPIYRKKERKARKINLELTEKEYEIYLYLINYFKEYGYAPSVREIGRDVGVSSTSTVKVYLDNLEKKKKIKKQSSARAICLLEYTFVQKKRVRESE